MRRNILVMAWMVLSAGVAFGQGSLTPPGAPSPTMKTLDELDAAIAGVGSLVTQEADDLDVAVAEVKDAVEQVEARIDLSTVAGNSTYHHYIDEPGSYYLSSNLEVTKTSGISIASEGVTLDLNGFAISRATGSGGYGIIIVAEKDRAVVRNGSIVGFDFGIRCYSTPAPAKGCLFENLAVSECITYGILAGTASRIIDCRVHDNIINGILAGAGSILSGCSSIGNGGNGIYAQDYSTLSDCAVSYNEGSYGIYMGVGSILSGCTASYNKVSYGIYVRAGSILSGCIASNNEGFSGIHSVEESTLSDCIAINNKVKFGIFAGDGSSLRDCVALNNEGDESVSFGIYVSGKSIIQGCNASGNSNTNSPGTSIQGVGIFLLNEGTVKDCTVSNNGGDGIRVEHDCLVVGNSCDGNGDNGDGAGIHVTSGDNRIDGNNVTDNIRGIDVDVSGSLIVRNSAAGNGSNWEVVANNACLVVFRTGCSAISGSSGGTAPGSTDPNANFSY